MIEKAKKYAIEKHNQPSASQRYGGEPYSVHLQDVVNIVNKYKYLLDDECHVDVVCAAWCHDSVEDTEATPSLLKNMFNERIGRIVLNVSNERGWDKKEILFKTLPKIWSCSLSKFVKLSDRIANGTNSKNGDTDKCKKSYKRYLEEYPIFRYALKEKGEYDEMWEELDGIFNYKICL